MLNYLTRVRMSYKLIALCASLVVLYVLVGQLVLDRILSSESVPVSKIGYCGAVSEGLCIFSFGRDLEGNMVISLFVPDRDFPEFYLQVKRAAVDSRYECYKNGEVPTNVYCVGDPIALQEKMEVSLVSIEDEQVLAAGNFILESVRLSPTQVFELPTATGTLATSTPSPTPSRRTPTPTLTSPAYP